MTETEIIDRYRRARDHLKQQYPDTWYQTGFLNDIEPVIADTYSEWQRAGLSDEAWWDRFVLSDLVFCLWAPNHIQDQYLERDFPHIAGEGSSDPQEEERFQQQQEQIRREKDWGVYVEPNRSEEQKRLRKFLNDLELDNTDWLEEIRKRQSK